MFNINSYFKPYSTETVTLTVEEEADLIVQAKDGSREATETLLVAYAPAMRSAVKTFMSRLPEEERNGENRDEAQAEAYLAFMETIEAHDPEKSPRLAGTISKRLTRSLANAAMQDAAMLIPERTLSRFYGILRRAEGDIEAAAALAPEMGMRTVTFNEVLGIVRNTVELSYGDEDGNDEGGYLMAHPIVGGIKTDYDEAEDAVLIDLAFDAVNDEEARVIELHYGFTGTKDFARGETIPDAHISTVVGMSRQKVQRTRAKGIDKMRKALGVESVTA